MLALLVILTLLAAMALPTAKRLARISPVTRPVFDGWRVCAACGCMLAAEGTPDELNCPGCGLKQALPSRLPPVTARHRWTGLFCAAGYLPGVFTLTHDSGALNVVFIVVYPLMMAGPVALSVKMVRMLAVGPRRWMPVAATVLLTVTPLCAQVGLIVATTHWWRGGWFDGLFIDLARFASPLPAGIAAGAAFTLAGFIAQLTMTRRKQTQ